MFDGLGKVLRALFCRKDEYILIEMTKKLSVRSLKSGNIFFYLELIVTTYEIYIFSVHSIA